MKKFRIRKLGKRIFFTVSLKKHGSRLIFEARRFFVPIVAFAIIVTGLIILSGFDFDWSSWKQSYGFGKRTFCEGIRNGTVRQPMNAWSSVVFIPIGLWAIRRTVLDYTPAQRLHRKFKQEKLYGILFGYAMVFLGIGSWMYHASFTYLGQFLDVAGMYLLGGFLFTYSIVRAFKLQSKTFAILYASLVIPVIILQWFRPETSHIAFRALVLGALGIEMTFHRSFRYKAFLWSVISLAVAYGIWLLDTKYIVCWPYSFMQGHAIWHVLTANSALLTFLFYRSAT